MTTQVIPVGNTATAFSAGEITVDAGTNVVLMIKASANGPIPVEVPFELAWKTSGGQYITVATLNANNISQLGRINGGAETATWAVRRPTSTQNSAGIDKA